MQKKYTKASKQELESLIFYYKSKNKTADEIMIELRKEGLNYKKGYIKHIMAKI